MRFVVVLVGAVLLSGCVSDGVGNDYASIAQKVGPPKRGQSRIVVLQEQRKGLSMAICACDMKLDGDSIGTVNYGTFVYADRPAGRHQLIASEALFPGESKRDFVTEAGRVYYFLVRTSERHDTVAAGTMVVGLAGFAVTSIATSGNQNAGPAEMFPLDEMTARTTLAELKLSE